MNPLVSIIVPSYNAASTLPTALSSLVAQTYPDWECIIVDDGSEDETSSITAMVRQKDTRIRCVRLEKNQGRGLARQVALEQASGQFIAMLDADDWVYPDKLEKQISAFRLLPDVILVSTGMAIADDNGDLAGVRCQGTPGKSLHSRPPIRLGSVPVTFAPSLIRLDVAKSTGFDQRLKRAEDWDFLLRLLMKNRYCILPDLTYVYNELGSVDFKNVRDSIRNGKLVIEKHRKALPRGYWSNRFRLNLQLVSYRILFGLGFGKWIIQRRSVKPAPEDLQQYCQAKDSVHAVKQMLFG